MSPDDVSISKKPSATRSADGSGRTMSQRHISRESPSNSSLNGPSQLAVSSGVMWNQSKCASTTDEFSDASAMSPILGSSIPASDLVSGISVKFTPSSL